MTYNAFVAVKMDAFAIGMKAKVGDLPDQDVEEMVTRAEEVLETTSPLFQAISGFAVQFELAKFDNAELVKIGNALTDYIENIPVSE